MRKAVQAVDTDKCLSILADLNDGMEIQESSSKMMNSIIQDLLDFSQIKADKFRRNMRKFNIRETVANVMKIQQKVADDRGLEFFATFPNIRLSEDMASN